MWNAVLILWATGAWIQTVTAQPGVGVPVPRLVVHTPRRALYAGSPVTFDAGWTTLPSAAGTYYYHFQFGDMDAAGVGKRQSVTKQGVPPSVTHVYERPGSYVANVTVSDVAFVDTAAIQGTVATSTASTGYAPLVATVLVDIVSANSECYEYSLSQPAVWNATCTATTSATSGSACLASTSAVSGKVTLDLLVKDPTGTYSSLAAAYNSIGDTPRVVVTNHTHTIEIESSSLVFTGTSWSFSLNASSLAGSISPMIARVESKKSGILSCAVQDTTLDLSVPRISNLGLGYDMSQTETGGAKAGLALRTGAYRPQYLRVAMNVCVKTQALAVFSAVSGGPSLNGLGALVATSADGFGESASLWNLARDSDGSQTTSRSLCGAAALTTAQCQELNVIDAVIVDSAVVLVSSVGVFVSNAIPLITTPAQSASLANYTLVRTGNAIVDAPGASVSKVSVYGRSDCLQPNIGRVFVTFPSASSAGSPVDSLIYATSLTAVMAGTFTTLTVSSIAALLPSAGLGASHSFVAVEHDTILSRHIYLFGIHRSAGCIGRRCSYTSPVIILHDPSTAKFIAAATLPTTLVVTGLKLHADGVHSVLFGSQIWVSQDGGQYWMQVYDLTPPTNVVTETFVDMESTTQGMGGIALITSSNRVFYGSVSALEFVAARTVPDLTGSLAALVAEGTGRLSVLTTDTVPTYGGTSVTYPSGFLADSAGSLRSAILKRLPIPGDSVVGSNADESFAATLVPVLLSSTRARLVIVPSPASASAATAGAVFRPHHRNWQITHYTGSKLRVESVASTGFMVDVSMSSPLVSEPNTISPAVDASITVSGLGANIADVTSMASFGVGLTSAPTMPTVTLTLSSLGPSGVGWVYSDIGKTAIVSQGSFLVSALTSTTVATGRLLQKPNLPAGSTTITAAKGDWKLLDFRPYNNHAGSFGQSITLSASGGLMIVTLSAGIMAFEAKHTNMILVTSSGWGVVQYVTPAGELAVAASQPLSASYAAGAWQLVRPTPDYVLSATQPTGDALTRSWKLAPQDCPSSAYFPIETSLSTHALYMNEYTFIDLQSNRTLPRSVSSSSATGPTGSSYLSTTVTSPRTGNYTVRQKYPHGNIGSHISTSIHAADKGTTGQTAVTVRSYPTSLKCTHGPSIWQTRVVHGCAPTRYIKLKLSMSDAAFLDGTEKLYGDVELVHTLPANYRPPSALGRLVPTTDNIYNADPSKPMHNTRFAVSKASGRYKQCAGKADRQSCSCTDSQRLSMKASNSDCIDKVLNVDYSKPYTPQIYAYQHANKPKFLRASYTLTELNNRVDYCISSVKDCRNVSALQAALFDPMHDKITWTGAEVYHFRAAVSTNDYCSLSTEFMVNVIAPPTGPKMLFMMETTTCVVFGMVLFGLYMYKSYAFNG